MVFKYKHQLQDNGFTLIELMVVISIIGMMSSIVFASLSSARDKGTIAAAQQFSKSLYTAKGADAIVLLNFDEGSGVATDSSGFGNDATLVGAVYDSANTVNNRGYSLYTDGITYAQVPYKSNFDFNQNGFTFSAWIKPTAYNQPYNMFMGKSLPYFNVGGGSNNQKLHMSMSAAGSQRSVYGSTVVTLSKWHHVAATYDSLGYMKVYLDGKLDGTAGPFLVPSISANNLYIGKWVNNATYQYTGYIDDVQYLNHALGYTEINKIYADSVALYHLADLNSSNK